MLGYVGITTAVRNRKDLFYKLLYFDDSQPIAKLETRFYIPKDGLYYIIFVNCNEKVCFSPLVLFCFFGRENLNVSRGLEMRNWMEPSLG